MTALTAPHDPVPAVRADRTDRALLGAAVGIAIVVHGLALLLPLPDRAATPPVVGRPDPPTWIRLPPPRPPEPPAIQAAPTADPRHPVPLPPEAQPDIEPLVEPAVEPIAAVDPDFVQPYVQPTAPPAPPAPAVYPEETEGLVRPQPFGERTRPVYPEIARRAGVGGQVVLRAVIDERGQVVDLEIVSAPRPDLGFADAAIEAVSRWRYRPGTIASRPVPVSMIVVVDFAVR